MNKKRENKRPLSDSLLFNLIAIGVAGILLVIITLLFLNIYTRHGRNVVVPELKGLQAAEAESLLKSKGLEVLIIDSIFKSDAVPGSIIDQTPKPNNRVKEGRSIYITIHSYNPQEISIPDLEFFSSRQAISLLNSIGFDKIDIEEVPNEFSGVVLSVEYKGRRLMANEQIPLGHPLKLIVGRGINQDSLNSDFDSHLERGVEIEKSKDSSNSSIDDSFF